MNASFRGNTAEAGGAIYVKRRGRGTTG
ncbi:MAG: hypothetical protein ACRDNS_15265, partial [Trebonia sp.]